ncbi:hypothetical protein ABL78_3012 [Leptomonas seymouri]|uniref:Trypanosoma Tc-38 (p38) protein domain-containing protein n=1 Tax=Leptomonas seymouri TaxID=5684 RepID=A0A0N1I6S9_LEPSE|nr:hypothetical protein ABL78_3012 [Leptomonas seymouri]|eukprot:KPI87902.1 hypothetical protein ABL78_3012 [Leptomonas seymouri]
MLRCTPSRWVVFTQGFPHLEHFAREHFLPSNPLSSCCLWLDEDDFRGVAMRAKTCGYPNPLRIDPYAHHPVLSRFATKTAGRNFETSPTAANSAAVLPVDQTMSDRQQIRHFLQNLDNSCSMGRSDSAHQVEQSSPKKKRGRPTKTVALSADLLSAERATAPDLSQYQVPICTVVISKPLYLLNLDQMFLDIQPELMGVGTCAGKDNGGAYVHGAPSSPADAFLRFPESHLSRDGLSRDFLSWGDTTMAGSRHGSPRSYRDFFSGTHNFGAARPCSEALLMGIRELQKALPNPTDADARFMFSVHTRSKYSLQRQYDLRKIALQHGYHSKWWGTRKQWANINVHVQPGQQEHVVPIGFPTKLVHISLIENATEVLDKAFIAPRKRRLFFYFDSHRKGVCDSTGVMEFGVVAERLGSVENAFPSALHGWRDSFDRLHQALHEDRKRMNYKLPLYFSKRHLVSLGLSVRPGALGVAIRRNDRQTAAQEGSDMEAADGAPQHLTGEVLSLLKTSMACYECWYHISQVHFPASYLISSAVLAEEMAHPGVALHGVTGVPLTYPELSYASLVNHRPEIAAALLQDAEEKARSSTDAAHSAPGTECAAATPTARADLPHEPPSSTNESMGHLSLKATQKEGGGVQLDPKDGRASAAEHFDELAVARFVSTHASPTLVKGRHLWFRAEDVLAANGIVDVNSTPVAVSEKKGSGTRIAGGSSSSASTDDAFLDGVADDMLFNVEALTDPDEALRKLSMPIAAL